jgi:hypothetical protein
MKTEIKGFRWIQQISEVAGGFGIRELAMESGGYFDFKLSQ